MVPDQISKLDLIQARIDVIPSDWQLCKVAEALNIRNNLRKPISQEVRETIKGDYPYYGPTKVQGYISEYEQDGTYALIGEDGDHFLKYATMPQTQYISGKCTVNNHAHILESSEICDAQWFFNYFKHRDITNFLSRQGAGRFKLNKATLEKLPMLVPPLSEQRKIAKIVSTWDKAITTTEKLIETSKQQKKALMQQLLTGKKRLINPETGKVFEGEWEEVHIGDICEVNPKKFPEPHNGLVSFIPMDAVSEDAKLLRTEVRKYTDVSKGFTSFKDTDTLIAKITPCFENGKGAKVTGLENGVGFGSTEFHVLRSKKGTCPNFVYFITNTSAFRVRGEMNMQGSAGQKRVTTDYLKLYKVSIPKELSEQQKIASVLTAADKDIEVLEAKLAHFKQEKKALMQQLLAGKRRVKIDEADVA